MKRLTKYYVNPLLLTARRRIATPARSEVGGAAGPGCVRLERRDAPVGLAAGTAPERSDERAPFTG
jgi:hypothetical protein